MITILLFCDDSFPTACKGKSPNWVIRIWLSLSPELVFYEISYNCGIGFLILVMPQVCRLSFGLSKRIAGKKYPWWSIIVGAN